MADVALTDSVKAMAMELGADLVGIAPVERWANAPLMMSPQGHLPEAKTVVVIGIHHPDAAVEMGGEEDGKNTPQHVGPYAVQYAMNTKLECISFQLARYIDDCGYKVVAIPATNIWRFRPYKEIDETFTPDLSDIHAAVAAGLGEIGFNGLFMSPEYGPRVRLCCLVCDADLEPTPLYDGPALCDRCMQCRKWCPTEAFTKEVKGEHVLDIGGKEVRYCNKNKWRCAWGEHFDLDLDLPKPDVVNEQVILEQLAEHGKRGGEFGSCLRFCLPPHLRLNDPDYCRPFRRLRRGMDARPMKDRVNDPDPVLPDRPATENLCKQLFDMEADIIGIASRAECEKVGLNLREALPDAESVVVFGIRVPESLQDPKTPADDARPEPLTGSVLVDWLWFMRLDGSRYLESLGYSAVPGTEIDIAKAIAATGLGESNAKGRTVTPEFGTRVYWSCIATSGYLQSGKRAHPVKPEKPQDMNDARYDLEAILLEEGADLVGVADPACIDKLIDQYRPTVDAEALKVNVVDKGGMHQPVKAEIAPREDARLRNVRDYLPDAKSVLVIGYHFPTLNLERAAEVPAEAVGPYSYATYQANRWLRYMAVKAARRLEEMGYKSIITTDLSDSGSVVANPRGAQPDALSNRFAAAAAGLCWIGMHGAAITPDYGVAQRFIAIVTDAALPIDEPLSEVSPCKDCETPCIEACPVAALSDDECTVIGCNGFEACLGKWDRLRCEWAKKYALLGDEGPKWGGQITNAEPPAGKVTPEQIAAAFAEKDPIQKHWTCILEGCLKACQCEGAWIKE